MQQFIFFKLRRVAQLFRLGGYADAWFTVLDGFKAGCVAAAENYVFGVSHGFGCVPRGEPCVEFIVA